MSSLKLVDRSTFLPLDMIVHVTRHQTLITHFVINLFDRDPRTQGGMVVVVVVLVCLYSVVQFN